MRSRNIKPSLFKNEILGVEDPFLTIVFAGLWCAADREGRIEDRPLRLKAEILPYRENIDFNVYLTELERLEFICRYEAEGMKVIEVLNFKKHQNPHKTEKQSDLPKKPVNTGDCTLTVNCTLNNGSRPADSLLLIPDSLIPEVYTAPAKKPDAEQTPEEVFYKTKKKRKLSGESLERFLIFWEAFGYAKGKAEAADAWIDVYKKCEFEAIIEGAKDECIGREDVIAKNQTPKMAQGWLSGRRWEDADLVKEKKSTWVKNDLFKSTSAPY